MQIRQLTPQQQPQPPTQPTSPRPMTPLQWQHIIQLSKQQPEEPILISLRVLNFHTIQVQVLFPPPLSTELFQAPLPMQPTPPTAPQSQFQTLPHTIPHSLPAHLTAINHLI